MTHDLRSLLTGSPRSIAAGLVPVHTREGLAAANNATLRKLDNWCEIMVPHNADGGGFGRPPQRSMSLSGPFPCAVGQRLRGIAESVQAPGGSVEGVSEWEIALLPDVQVPLDSRIAVPGWFNAWLPDTAYALDSRVIPTNASGGTCFWFEVAQAGDSHATVEPTWLPANGVITPDNTVRWRFGGVVSFFEVTGTDDSQSNVTEKVVLAKKMT